MSDKKIIITGTGRSGTTFVMLIFSYLKLDTGYEDEKQIKRAIFPDCNAGLESKSDGVFTSKKTPKIIKNPNIITNIEDIVKSGVEIEHIFIPIRDYHQSAKSRESNKQNGGFWQAKNVNEQVDFYRKIMSEYLFYMAKYDLNTTFIDFERMITNKRYTFEKLSPALGGVSFEDFSEAFDKADYQQKNKPIKS